MQKKPERKLAAHVQAAIAAGQAKMGAQMGGPTAVRRLAPHVQAAVAAGQAKSAGAPQDARQATAFVVPNREMAPHVQRAVAAAHVQAPIAAGRGVGQAEIGSGGRGVDALQPMRRVGATVRSMPLGSSMGSSFGFRAFSLGGGGGDEPPRRPPGDLLKGHYVDYERPKNIKKDEVETLANAGDPDEFTAWTWMSGENTKSREGDRWDALEIFAACPEGSVGRLHYHGLAPLMEHIGAIHSADVGNFFAQHAELLRQPVTMERLTEITGLETAYWNNEWEVNRSVAGLLGRIVTQQIRLGRLLNTYRAMYGGDPPPK